MATPSSEHAIAHTVDRSIHLDFRMSQQNDNRTRKPAPEDRAYVSQLIESHSLNHAAKVLGLSRLATSNIARGGRCYVSTLAVVTQRRVAGAA